MEVQDNRSQCAGHLDAVGARLRPEPVRVQARAERLVLLQAVGLLVMVIMEVMTSIVIGGYGGHGVINLHLLDPDPVPQVLNLHLKTL